MISHAALAIGVIVLALIVLLSIEELPVVGRVSH